MNENEETLKNQTKGLKRNTIDKFYTKKNIVEMCMNLIKDNIRISKKDLIIEPSAGNGSFIENIKTLTNNYKFYDLEPEHNEIIKQDYLELEYNNLKKDYNRIHIIGNPPFGRQSSLAIKFIKKSCEYAKSISFILPKSFKKESMKKHFNQYFHMIHEIDIPEKSFLVNNIECDVPCIFQIWSKKKVMRELPKKLTPINYQFVDKNENPDISFRRVGVYAGTISKDVENKSEQSHYFIKFLNNKSIDENIEKINKIVFDSNNTVGPKSISKQELIIKYNNILF